jgi:hypothetical protein
MLTYSYVSKIIFLSLILHHECGLKQLKVKDMKNSLLLLRSMNSFSTIKVDTDHVLTEDMFTVAFLIDSFEATVSLRPGNLNLARSRISALGLYVILTALISTPEFYPALRSILATRKQAQSVVVCELLKRIIPLYRSEGTYSVGNGYCLEEVLLKIAELREKVLEHSVPIAGSLSNKSAFLNFQDNVAGDLDYLSQATDPSDFVGMVLDLLSPLPNLLTAGQKSWEQLEPTILGQSPDDAILGLRKCFWIDPSFIACSGEIPEPVTIYLFQLLVETTYSTVGLSRRRLNTPSSGHSVVGIITERRLSIIRYLLESFSKSSTPAGEPDGKARRRKGSVPPVIPIPAAQGGGRSFSTYSFVGDVPTFATIIDGKVRVFSNMETMASSLDCEKEKK